MSTTEIEQYAEPLLPMEPAQARKAMAQYQQLTDAMLGPEDWQQISREKRFVKRSGFQKISTGYSLSCEILSEEVVERDERGEPVRARAIVRAMHPNGRHWDGSGRCSITERGFSKAEHDLTATAITRATNRAISNLVGFGAVSAEELDGAVPVAVQDDPALDDDQLFELVAELEKSDPDAGRFVESLSRRLGGNVTESVGVALRAWSWWTSRPVKGGREGPQSASEGVTEPSTEV